MSAPTFSFRRTDTTACTGLTGYSIRRDNATGPLLRSGVYTYDDPGNLTRHRRG